MEASLTAAYANGETYVENLEPAATIERRRLRDPFAEDARPMLVHIAQHTTGTVWFERVLTVIAKEVLIGLARMVVWHAL
jgi:hypothetical protein